jgi:hypothetical protein
MRRLKAFIIATISLFRKVTFKRKKRVNIELDYRKHVTLTNFLGIFFDLRYLANGRVQLRLAQRRKANYERGI